MIGTNPRIEEIGTMLKNYVLAYPISYYYGN